MTEEEALKNLQALRTRRILLYEPYIKQQEFHADGATCRERLFLAGNQLGKTLAGGSEFSMHMRGEYPEGWKGRVFRQPIRAWSAGITNMQTRDNAQRILFGEKGSLGMGTIPLDSILDITWSRVISDFIDTATIRHDRGSTSYMAFKAYEQGKKQETKASPWGGDTLNLVWFDEEPPEELYGEGLARISATGGLAFITATPLLGMTEVIRKFFPEPEEEFRSLTMMNIDEALHIPKEDREAIVQGYPKHEREARVMGIPMLGSGRVFTVPEEMIREESIPIPEHWPQIGGIDFGWDHPTACVWAAWDRDNDVIHITHCYKQKEETPIVHSAAMKTRGDWIPWAWPHDGYQHDKQAGEPISVAYRKLGINMLPEHSTFAQGGYSLEARVLEFMDRMQTGRLKVAEHLMEWFEEYRLYHRKKGLIVKDRDDLISATGYLMMMLRFARIREGIQLPVTTSLDYDPLNPVVQSRSLGGDHPYLHGGGQHSYLRKIN